MMRDTYMEHMEQLEEMDEYISILADRFEGI
jgi:hypothetical protein